MDSEQYLREYWYDFERGYDNTNPGWYEVTVHTNNNSDHKEMVTWLFENIDLPERHCNWVKHHYVSKFKFRYERDYIYFRLRW